MHLGPVLALLACGSGLVGAAEPAKPSRAEAIERGLKFLQHAQQADGSWSVRGPADRHGVTALCVLAFLSAGHGPGRGPYGDTVEKAVGWVSRSQRADGAFAVPGSSLEMYNHGIATLMLAQVAAGMPAERRKGLKPALDRAVALILKAQRKGPGVSRGGWRYQVAPLNDGDLTNTTWQLLALRAARQAGCTVPDEAIDRGLEFVRRCDDPVTGGFRYMPSANVTLACTAGGLLSLALWDREGARGPQALKAAAYLVRRLPRWDESFFLYAAHDAAQALFLAGGNYWAVYRPKIYDILLARQRADGSWLSPPEAAYGPAYSTALAVLVLTVEEGRLPVYRVPPPRP
jgi:hypothetical protein